MAGANNHSIKVGLRAAGMKASAADIADVRERMGRTGLTVDRVVARMGGGAGSASPPMAPARGSAMGAASRATLGGAGRARSDAAAAKAKADMARATASRANKVKTLRQNKPWRSPQSMTAGQINKELDRLGVLRSKNTDAFIRAGRGHERPSDYAMKTDPLSREANRIQDRHNALRAEIDRRYGPGAPSRLPRGF